MEKLKKSIVTENQSNLYNRNRILYNMIFKYGISHLFLAEQLYPKEWAEIEKLLASDDEEDKEEAIKRKRLMTGKLRNRLDGKGKLTMQEYGDLLTVMAEMADSLLKNKDEAFKIYDSEKERELQRIAKDYRDFKTTK